MPLTTTRARCGLPTNPREWILEKKKPYPKENLAVNIPGTLEEEKPNIEPMGSPMVHGEFEDLIEYYSNLEEDYWTNSTNSSNIPVPLRDHSLQGSITGKYESSTNSGASDRSSLISQVSNVSNASSGKSARRKKRIFPGIFTFELLEQPLVINTKNLSLASHLSEEIHLSNTEILNHNQLYLDNIQKIKSHSPTRPKEYQGLEQINETSKYTNLNIPRKYEHSEKIPYNLQESISPNQGKNICWDEMGFLEEYSSIDNKQNSYESHSNQINNEEGVAIKFNMMISVSEKCSEIDNFATYPNGTLSTNSPLSANSDLSRYSVD